MRLIHVIPIAKGIQKDRLSYFSTTDMQEGTLVRVPLRNRTVFALVIGSEDAKDVRQSLRKNTFTIKKVSKEGSRTVFLPAFFEAARGAAEYFASSTGAVLHQLIPAILIENADALPDTQPFLRTENTGTSSELLAFQADMHARLDDYRRVVREAFARNSSVYILTPTIKETEYVAEELSKGIETYVYALHSNVAKKELLKRICTLLKDPHPVLMVGTGGFLAVPRADVETIIVEREAAKSYKMQTRPYIDYPVFARFYGAAKNARVIYADMPLSIETTWRLKQREYEEFGSNRARLTTSADQYVIDMRPDEEQKEFFILSTPLLENIEKTTGKDRRTFVFAARRGLAPTTVCEDCGAVVTCTRCHAPVVLHSATGGNVFVCHSCGDARNAKERCKRCNSWKLKVLGIGAERVRNALIEHVGKKRVFSIDSDSTKTYKQAEKQALEFYRTPGAILVGTELALSFLHLKVHNTAIVSMDSLLLLPDPKMYENVFSLILRVRAIAENTFIIQTRQPELPLIRHAMEGNVTAFYESEILNRRRFEYPPFAVLIKISSLGTTAHISKEMEYIEERLKGYPFYIYPAFNRTGKNRYVLHGLLKVPADTWPDAKLLEILRSLPPSISVNVSPESTL